MPKDPEKGFTLIELLVVVSIISLLSSVVMASLNTARDKARIAAGQRFAFSTHNAIGSETVAMWDFNEGSGSTAVDTSGKNNNGTISGATWTTGVKRGALSFDGIDDWVNIPVQPDIKTGPNSFTIAGTINPDNQYSRFITPQSHGVDQWIGYDAANERIETVISQSADINTRNRPSTTGSVPVGKWTHFAISIHDLSVRIYINGALNAQYAETISIADWVGSWAIGQRGINTDWYKGKIDDIRLYSTVLTASEIQKLYAQSVAEGGDLAAK